MKENSMVMSIDPFIHRKVIVLKDSETARQAARAMSENQIGCVMLANKRGRISGILTDRDLVCDVLAENVKVDAPARLIMSKAVVTGTPKMSVEKIIDLMKKHGVRRIPIIDYTARGKQKCIGIVTLDDLIAANVVPPMDLRQIVQSQTRKHMGGEAQSRLGARTLSLKEFFNQLYDLTGIPVTKARRATRVILWEIVMRLHHTAAEHFIHGLPLAFQPDLLRTLPGPNRKIDAKSLVAGVAATLGTSPNKAKSFIKDFWWSLRDVALESALDHAWHQLPADMQNLLKGDPSED
jgi:CBS domain-containing protein